MVKNSSILLISILVFSFITSAIAQIPEGVFITDQDNIRHELKVSDEYFIHTIYQTSPSKFIKTVGGFYTISNSSLEVQLEFNSDYAVDSVSIVKIPYKFKKGQLIFDLDTVLVFDQIKPLTQDLDGQWLFATRGPDTGQVRRGEENSRKTLKYLQDNRFQWIAFNTESFKFHGTGGGSFSSKNGVYTELIDFFSKDNSRVGAALNFNYELQNTDWHHTGMNSKGKPMYEIWSKRVSK